MSICPLCRRPIREPHYERKWNFRTHRYEETLIEVAILKDGRWAHLLCCERDFTVKWFRNLTTNLIVERVKDV